MGEAVEDLLAQLTAAGRGELGHGPDHPTAPEVDLVAHTDDLLARVPHLRSDPEYTYFLRRYSGGSFYVARTNCVVNVHGFCLSRPWFEWPQVGEVDATGAPEFTFADSLLVPPGSGQPKLTTVVFGLSGRGAARPVVRACAGVSGRVGPEREVCDGFLAWLELMVVTGGTFCPAW